MNHILGHINNYKTFFPLFSQCSLVGGLPVELRTKAPINSVVRPRHTEGEHGLQWLACHALKSSVLISGYTLLNFQKKNTVITRLQEKSNSILSVEKSLI